MRNEIIAKVEKLILDFKKKPCVKKTANELVISIAQEYHLLYQYSIQRKKWIADHCSNYLNCISPQSDVEIQMCDRYSLEDNKGLKVVAKKKLKKKRENNQSDWYCHKNFCRNGRLS